VALAIAMTYYSFRLIKFHVPKSLAVGAACAFAALLASQMLQLLRRPAPLGEKHVGPIGAFFQWARAQRFVSLIPALLQWSEGMYVLAMAGAFLALTHCFISADFSYSPDRTWFSCATIASIGLVAAVGAIPRDSAWRVVASVAAIAAMPYFAYKCPTGD